MRVVLGEPSRHRLPAHLSPPTFRLTQSHRPASHAKGLTYTHTHTHTALTCAAPTTPTRREPNGKEEKRGGREKKGKKKSLA